MDELFIRAISLRDNSFNAGFRAALSQAALSIHASELRESAEAIHCALLVPGRTPDRVSVVVDTGSVLRVHAPAEQVNGWTLRELSFQLPLDQRLDADKLTAEVKQGVLFITVPKKASRTVPVQG